MAGHDVNQKGKGGGWRVACDKCKGEIPVKGEKDRGDKSRMERAPCAPRKHQGDNSQMDQGRAQGVSEVG